MAEKEKKAEKKSNKKKHKVKSMHIRKADNGGFIAQHELPPDEQGAPQPGQEHILPDIGALQQHVGDHFGDEEEGEQK
jgi:hypothetical protein